MISRFFEGTKPINYLVLLLILLVFFVFKSFGDISSTLLGHNLASSAVGFLFLALQIFLVNEIARKANLTELSSYPMLFFILLVIAFPEASMDINLILCNFFVVLAFQDLLTKQASGKSNLNFFSSTLWLCIASLFYPVAAFFFIPVLMAILFYGPDNIRNWLMPITAVLCFLLIGYAITLLMSMPDFFAQHYRAYLPKNLFSQLNFERYTRLIFYLIANTILLFIIFSRLQDVGKGRVLELRMLLMFFISGILLTLFTLGLEISLKAIIFTFCPVSIFITNYFQIFRKKRLKEFILFLIIVAPISIGFWKVFS